MAGSLQFLFDVFCVVTNYICQDHYKSLTMMNPWDKCCQFVDKEGFGNDGDDKCNLEDAVMIIIAIAI